MNDGKDSNWINGACILASHAFNNSDLPCSENVVHGRQMVVALANSNWDPEFYQWACDHFTKVVVGIGLTYNCCPAYSIVNPTAIKSFARFGAFDFTGSGSLDPANGGNGRSTAAAKQLAQCIKTSCCGGPRIPAPVDVAKDDVTIVVKESNGQFIPKTMGIHAARDIMSKWSHVGWSLPPPIESLNKEPIKNPN